MLSTLMLVPKQNQNKLPKGYQMNKAMTADTFIEMFPYDQPRAGQMEAVQQITKAFDVDKKKIVILEAPTGTGKSVLAYTLANYYNTTSKLGTYVLTSSKQLQDQYVKDAKHFDAGGFKTVKGQANYICSVNPTRTCRTGVCKSIDKVVNPDGITQKTCPCEYKHLKNAAYRSKFTVLNYPYFLEQMLIVKSHRKQIDNYDQVMEINDKPFQHRRGLLVCDEAHNIEGALTNLATLHVNPFDMRKHRVTMIPTPAVGSTDKQIINWVKHDMLPLLEDDLMDAEMSQMEHNSASAKVDFLSTMINNINRMLGLHSQGKPFAMHVDKENGVVIKPLNASNYIKPMLDTAERVLMMSATILNPREFCKSLGIDFKTVEFIQVPSHFPLANSPIVDWSDYVGKLNRNNLSEKMPTVVKLVKHVLKKHEGERGIIHTTTYAIANQIVAELIGTPHEHRVYIPKGVNRAKDTWKHMNKYPDAVLVSPSMTEGIDLNGDWGKFGIIVKCPFLNLGDKYVQMKKDQSHRWYTLNTLRTIMQARGRTQRSATDKSHTYILDKACMDVIWANMMQMPDYFLDAIVKPKTK